MKISFNSFYILYYKINGKPTEILVNDQRQNKRSQPMKTLMSNKEETSFTAHVPFFY